jgi:hypothetical protein
VRFRTLTIALAIALLAAVMLAAPAFAKDPSVPQVKKWLGHARQVRQRAVERAAVAAANLAGAKDLYAATSASAGTTPAPAAGVVTPPAGMDQTLAATLLADGVVTADEIASLQARFTTAQRRVHRWDLKVRKLERRLRELKQIATWNRQGRWKPLIAIASQRYHVSAAGLAHMMKLESNGQRHVDSGPYHGLFQFMYREWAMSWNEWRDHSIYDGWSQIQLAAKCISRGMGPSIWPLTYRMSF